MNSFEALIKEVQYEADKTRKMLEVIPQSAWSWKPHDKSMELGKLAIHIADFVANWITMTMQTKELDFATSDYSHPDLKTPAELIAFLDKSTAEAITAIKAASDADYYEPWTMRNGDHIFFTLPRIVVLRDSCINHAIHHRGQLSVYLRLLNVALPPIYGPTADSGTM